MTLLLYVSQIASQARDDRLVGAATVFSTKEGSRRRDLHAKNDRHVANAPRDDRLMGGARVGERAGVAPRGAGEGQRQVEVTLVFPPHLFRQ